MLALGLVAAGAVTLALDSSSTRDERALNSALCFSGAAMFSALGLVIGLGKSPAERMLELYRDDPRIKLRLTPTASSRGAGLNLSGSF